MTERVTYYSNIDGSIWLYLPRIESILRNFDIASTPTSIVDAVELYHVSLFFKNKHYAETWSDETIVDFERKANSIDGVIYRYCQGLQPCKIKDLYFHLDYTYQETFWEIINKYKLWGLITNDVLKDILETEESVIHKILYYGTLVIQYESVIVQYFKSHPKTAEILLSTYIELDRFNNRKEIYIPKSLTISDREQIINQYIESANPNPNYLNLISQITPKDKENLSISPKIRIKAEEVSAKISDDFFKDKNTGVHYGLQVSISQEKGISPIHIGLDPSSLNLEYTYSEEYILSCKGTKHIDNFLSLFEFLNRTATISFVSHKHGDFSLFDLFGMRAKNEYPLTMQFRMAFRTAMMQTVAYMHTLETHGIYLEDIIKEFYNNVLLEDYGYNGIDLNIPGHESPIVDKIRTILPEIESIVRQYDLYVKEGDVNPQILALTDAIKITDCASIVPKKYIYIFDQNSNPLQRVSHLFFSDQTTLCYVEPYKKDQYHTLYELLLKEKVQFDSYEAYQKHELQWLIDEKYLFIDSEGYICITNRRLIKLLSDLYRYDVCMYWNYTPDIRTIIDDYINKGYLYAESSLLCHSEQDLYSFVLNNERFSNALAYRNKYLHGTIPPKADHRAVYANCIMLLICLLFKIEHDLQVGKQLKEKKPVNELGVSI